MTEANEMATDKKFYVGNIEDFTINPENARESYNVEVVKEAIKASGGMKVPGFVYPSSYKIDEKRVVFDGNTRLLALQELANDEEYLSKGGSLDFPYIVLPNDVAKDRKKAKAFMFTLGTSNQQLVPKEQAQVIFELYQDYLADIKSGIICDDKGKAIKTESKQEAKAKQLVADDVCKTSVWISTVIRVFEKKDTALDSIIDEGIIPYTDVPKLVSTLDKFKSVPTADFIELCQESNRQRGKGGRISRNDIDVVSELLETENNDLIGHVKNGLVPFALVPEVVTLAKDANTDVNGVIAEATQFSVIGEPIDREALEQAKNYLVKNLADFVDNKSETSVSLEDSVNAKIDQLKASNPELDDDSAKEMAIAQIAEANNLDAEDIKVALENEETEDEKVEITEEILVSSKQTIKEHLSYLENLEVKDFEGLEPHQVLQLEALIEKVVSKSEKMLAANIKAADRLAKLAIKEQEIMEKNKEALAVV